MTENNEEYRGPYEDFQTDPDAEREGVKIDFGKYSVRVARAGGENTKFQRLFRQRIKPYWRQYENQTLSEELSNKIILSCFADAVVLGWENVRDRKGELIPYSRENVIKVFTELPDFFRMVREEAMKFGNFLAGEVEQAAGN